MAGPSSVTVKVDGLKELDAALLGLKRATSGNVLKRALTTAAEPLRDEAKRLAPDDPRTGGIDLKASITIANLKAKQRGQFGRAVRIAPAIDFEKSKTGKPGGRWFASQALEFGWGDMPIKPYMRPAWDHKKNDTLEAFKRALKVEIDKAIARQLKRGG